MSLLGSVAGGIGLGTTLGGGLLGGLLGGGQQQQNVSQTTAPWAAQQPFLKNIYGEAQNLYNLGGPQVYQGSTVSPFSPYQTQGIEAQAALAQNPQTTQAATDYYNKVLGGDYLYGGEGFNAALDAANRKIQPIVGSMFEGAGRYGSGLQQSEVAGRLGDVFAGMYGQERQNQQQALGMSPMIQNLGYTDASQLFNAGQAQQGQAQAELSDVVNRFTQEQQRPYENLSQYASTIYGSPSFPSQTQPYYRNQNAGILGGALGGGTLGFQIGGPWGAAIGAGLGGLLGRG